MVRGHISALRERDGVKYYISEGEKEKKKEKTMKKSHRSRDHHMLIQT